MAESIIQVQKVVSFFVFFTQRVYMCIVMDCISKRHQMHLLSHIFWQDRSTCRVYLY